MGTSPQNANTKQQYAAEPPHSAHHFLVIGGANFDLNGMATHSQLSTADSWPGTISYAYGGVARNIAENLARLHQSVCFISRVGQDDHGVVLCKNLSDIGVDLSHCQIDEKAPTDSYISIHDSAGEMVAALNAMALVTQLEIEPVLNAIPNQDSYHTVVIDANLSQEMILALARHTPVKQIVADAVSVAKVAKLSPILERLYLLKCNRSEAVALTQEAADASLAQLGRGLNALGVKIALISDGANGASLTTEAEHLHLKLGGKGGMTSGAGDGLLAGVLFGHAQGYSFQQMLETGLVLASITLRCNSPVHPDLTPHLLAKETSEQTTWN